MKQRYGRNSAKQSILFVGIHPNLTNIYLCNDQWEYKIWYKSGISPLDIVIAETVKIFKVVCCGYHGPFVSINQTLWNQN